MNDDFMKREFSDDFVQKMRHRVEMSYHKYGSALDNFGAGRVDAPEIRCISAERNELAALAARYRAAADRKPISASIRNIRQTILQHFSAWLMNVSALD